MKEFEGNGDGEFIIYENKQTDTLIKRKDLLCWKCAIYSSCEWRDNTYSTNGDCLADK